MTGDQLRKELASYIDKMPPLPTSVGRIMDICQRPNAQPSDLNRVISLDPVLLARVMKLVNSAYYGLTQEVTSLVRAIIMLGLNTVKNMALSTAVLGTMNTSHTKNAVLNLEGFWLHSLCTGVTAKLIAKKRDINQQELENYFFCGLLHDIGKIPLNNRVPETYLTALTTCNERRISLIQAEEITMNYTHTEAGSMIMASWKLNDEISDVVAWHHQPLQYTGNYRDILFSVAIADYFANIMEIGFSGNRFPAKPSPEIFSALNIKWLEVEDMEAEVKQEIEKAKVFLRLSK